MNDYTINQSLSIASDLDRISASLQRNSRKVAKRFTQEVLHRQKLINEPTFPKYIKEILKNLPQILSQKDIRQKADDALMYSILLQNYVMMKK